MEIIKPNTQQEKFSTDQKRLSFLERKIIECVKNTLKQPDKTADQSILVGLDNLRRELEEDAKLVDYLPELNAIIDVIRIMFLSRQKIRYKEHQVMTGAPQISEEETQRQESLKEDMTEGRSIMQWHIAQNESNPDYLRTLFMMLRNSMEDLGFEYDWRGMERGLQQELGVLKILKKHFKKVTPGNPKEDAHYAIDFWAETNNGSTVIFQSKSSFAFMGEGVYNEDQISDLEKKLSTDPNQSIKYRKGSGNQELRASDLVQVRKLQRDIKKAKEYAQSLGITKPGFYLIVSSADNYKEITGEPDPRWTKSIENELWQISVMH